jgi:hypothetical protein
MISSGIASAAIPAAPFANEKNRVHTRTGYLLPEIGLRFCASWSDLARLKY